MSRISSSTTTTTTTTTSCLLCFLSVACLITFIDGFGIQPKGSLSSLLSEKNRGATCTTSRLQYQNEESPTSAATSTTSGTSGTSPETCINKEKIDPNNNNNNNNDHQEWGLWEDWALQDSVPRYTIGTADRAKTFWAQLRHSTPELARWTEDELENRYREWYGQSKDSLLVEGGPSPTLLSDWWVSSSISSAHTHSHTHSNSHSHSHSHSHIHSNTSADRHSIVTTMGGTLPNGSQIWFPLKCAGTLGEEDPNRTFSSSAEQGITKDVLDDCYISAFITLHTSSYAESTADVVYELGFPRCEANKVHGPRSGISRRSTATPTPTPTVGSKQVGAHDASVDHHHQEGAATALGEQLDKLRHEFVSKATQNAGVILATSTLSACVALGYVGGQPSSSSSSVVHDREANIVATNQNKPSSSSSSSKIQLTVNEQRARAELKVGRDKRSLVLMQERLKEDELKLKELQKEESRLEAAEWGF